MRAKLLFTLFSVYLVVALPYLFLSYGRPLREESAKNLQLEKVKITYDGNLVRFQARLKPYISRNTTLGIGVVIPALLETTDDPRDVLRNSEPSFMTNSPPASSCVMGVLFWSSQGPERVRYSLLNWGRRQGRWMRFTNPDTSSPAGLPATSYNATIWLGNEFWTVTGIEVEKVLDLGFLRFLLTPAIILWNFWIPSLAILVGIVIWWRFLKKLNST